MRLIQSTMLGVALAALATGSAWPADKSADEKTAGEKPAEELTFADLDKNNNRFISKAEAKADPVLANDFDKFDLNHDGKLSREEYLAARGKEDTRPAATKAPRKAKTASTSGDGVKQDR